MSIKEDLLKEFREKAEEFLSEIVKRKKNYKLNASEINKCILAYRNSKLDKIANQKISDKDKLEAILLICYVCNVVMLEYRNKVWGYDYMAFSRRIGEIWEPFCKLPFHFPVKQLELYDPPTFNDIQKALKDKIHTKIGGLIIPKEDKRDLLQYYEEVWQLIDSGSISLSLDLHFKQGGQFYDVDYKSGFSSNEKGNTNRLLLVASIYNSLPDKHNNLIFVRQKEEENNHYLQTLKNSKYWDVYCADDAYEKIKEFTGFDLKNWMNTHMIWVDDISPDFRKYLKDNDLLKYLTW